MAGPSPSRPMPPVTWLIRTPTSPGNTVCTGGRSTSSNTPPSSTPTASRRRPRGLPKVSMRPSTTAAKAARTKTMHLMKNCLIRFMSGSLFVGDSKGRERPGREAGAGGAEDLDDVLAGLEAVARPAAPGVLVAGGQVVTRDLDAVAGPHVLDEAGAVARDRRVRVHRVARAERVLGALAPDHLAVHDPAADGQRGVARREALA